MFVLPFILAAAAATSSPADLFIQRVADMGVPQRRKVVTQGALPPGWTPPAPLPQGLTLLGSVSTPNFETQVYYAPSDAAAAAKQYDSQLQAAGYRERLGVAGHSGFGMAQFTGNLNVMCKSGGSVSILVPGSNDLRVTFSAKTVGDACTPQAPSFRSPVPDLIAPAGVVMIGGGGGTGYTSAIFNAGSVFSSAIFRTSLSAKQLIAAFASQMRAAQWKGQTPFTSPQGAAQRFTWARGTQHWTGTILIFTGTQAHTYEGRLEASGTPQLGMAANISPARPAAKLTPSQIPAALALAQRVADTYTSTGAPAQIYVGKLPPLLDKHIPLPSGSLVGAVANDNGATLYYTLTHGQFDAYLAKLRAGGWSVLPQPVPFAAGFAASTFGTTTFFCKAGMPRLSAGVHPHTNDVQIGVITQSSSCSQPLPVMFPLQSAPVPQLTAPEGVKMQPGSVGIPGGQSGASLTTTLPLSAVLAAFAAQFTEKSWIASAPVVSDALGSQSFAFTDDKGKKWQAVLTIYRSNADAHTYYAFIDATPL